MKKYKPLTLIALFLVMTTMGALRGEGLTVLEKGIRICLECVGIG